MNCFLYCILRAEGLLPAVNLRGVDGRPVEFLTCQGLAAALSRMAPDTGLSPQLDRLRAYDRVVAALHRHRTVIPLRYGCRLADGARVVQLLAERGPRYQALLRELDGCVEMGIRILLPQMNQEPSTPPPPLTATGPGRNYLQVRRARYDHLDRYTRMTVQFRASLAGLYVQEKSEGPGPGQSLLTLYYLVPRGAVGAFRRVFRSFPPPSGAQLVLSGPWPPYNFVMADHPHP